MAQPRQKKFELSRQESLSKPNLCMMLGVLGAHYRVLPEKNIRHLMNEIEEIETLSLQNYKYKDIQYMKREIQREMLSRIKNGRDRHIKPIHIELYNFLSKTVKRKKVELQKEQKLRPPQKPVVYSTDIIVYVDEWVLREITFLSLIRGNLPRHVMILYLNEKGQWAPKMQALEYRPFGPTPECMSLFLVLMCQRWVKKTLQNALMKAFFLEFTTQKIYPNTKYCNYYGACNIWKKYAMYTGKSLKKIAGFMNNKRVSFCTNWHEPHPIPQFLAKMFIQQSIWTEHLKKTITCLNYAFEEEA